MASRAGLTGAVRRTRGARSLGRAAAKRNLTASRVGDARVDAEALLRSTDLDDFGYLIVNGTPGAHASVASWRVMPLTTSGRWRLYRVTE
jgi:hypothetical protein